MIRFFSFDYTHYEDQKVAKQGKHLYYTSASTYNIEAMRDIAREILKVANAVISIGNVTEITREEFSCFKVNGFIASDSRYNSSLQC